MINWLVRHTVRDWQNTSDTQVRGRYGILAGIVGVISNLFLFLIKFLTGFFFHSIAIMADAVNNLSDAGSSVITLAGFYISGKPADPEHPYGHARMEYISGLLVSIVIIFLGLQLTRSSFDKILHPDDTLVSPVMLGVLVVSILLKLGQSYFNRTIGRRIDSTALQATAADSLNDVYATSAVLISALVMRVTGIQLDGWMVLAVAVYITISGIKLAMETANPLLGTAPDPELVHTIHQKVMSYPGVIGIHDLVVHSYGTGNCFASLHAEVPADEDILVSHDIIDNIERDIQQELGIHLVIHMDPVVTNDPRVDSLRQMVRQCLEQLDPQLSMHDFRVVFGATHTNLVFDVVVPIRFALSDEELTARLTQLVQAQDPHLFVVLTVDRNYCGC